MNLETIKRLRAEVPPRWFIESGYLRDDDSCIYMGSMDNDCASDQFIARSPEMIDTLTKVIEDANESHGFILNEVHRLEEERKQLIHELERHEHYCCPDCGVGLSESGLPDDEELKWKLERVRMKELDQ